MRGLGGGTPPPPPQKKDCPPPPDAAHEEFRIHLPSILNIVDMLK